MSKPPRFFIDPSQVAGPVITITGDDLRHIRTVLRKQPGDLLTLLDGKGREYTARIEELRKDGIAASIIDQRQRETKGPHIVLGQGIAKSDKMDWIVQKATEIGASSIIPLVTERTIVKVKDEEKRVGRWRKIAREAAMQSDRADIPAIEDITNYRRFLSRTPPGPPLAEGEDKGGGSDTPAVTGRTLLLLPWEEASRPVKDVLRSHPGVETVVVLIGPEGGFSASEAGLAQERGFHAVSLGPNILRTETAAVAALSIIGYELG